MTSSTSELRWQRIPKRWPILTDKRIQYSYFFILNHVGRVMLGFVSYSAIMLNKPSVSTFESLTHCPNISHLINPLNYSKLCRSNVCDTLLLQNFYFVMFALIWYSKKHCSRRLFLVWLSGNFKIFSSESTAFL